MGTTTPTLPDGLRGRLLDDEVPDEVARALGRAAVDRVVDGGARAALKDRRRQLAAGLVLVVATAVAAALPVPPLAVWLIGCGAALVLGHLAERAADAAHTRRRRLQPVRGLHDGLTEHMGAGPAATVLIEAVHAPGADAGTLREAVLRAVDEHGCFAGHSRLCRHRRGR